ncbi:hypothetical protein AB8Z38_17340 [Bradyrhizobium sp. LLZ17]|uniref:Uncharacterized protein n=1 Tax=Bradyrhizobium sp. LLZ17 TaxID=3239388 RepID=A0AB39XUM4_9BRAD
MVDTNRSERRAWALAQAIPGAFRSQGAAADVSALYLAIDLTGRSQSVQPMAARLGPREYDQLHHFIAMASDAAPVERNCSFRPISWSAAKMRC